MTDNSDAKSKAREFWIKEHPEIGHTYQVCQLNPLLNRDGFVHVIEYSAFQKLLYHANELEKHVHCNGDFHIRNKRCDVCGAGNDFRAFKKENGL